MIPTVSCDWRTTYGIRPSSFLTYYNVIVGVSSSALLPLLGTIVDHTHHRRLVAKASAEVYCVALFPMVFLNESTWFAACALLVFTAFSCFLLGLRNPLDETALSNYSGGNVSEHGDFSIFSQQRQLFAEISMSRCLWIHVLELQART